MAGLTLVAAIALAFATAMFSVVDDHIKTRNDARLPISEREHADVNVFFDFYVVRMLLSILAIIPSVVFVLGAKLAMIPVVVFKSLDPEHAVHIDFYKPLFKFLHAVDEFGDDVDDDDDDDDKNVGKEVATGDDDGAYRHSVDLDSGDVDDKESGGDVDTNGVSLNNVQLTPVEQALRLSDQSHVAVAAARAQLELRITAANSFLANARRDVRLLNFNLNVEKSGFIERFQSWLSDVGTFGRCCGGKLNVDRFQCMRVFFTFFFVRILAGRCRHFW
jgi:hypothetical protein